MTQIKDVPRNYVQVTAEGWTDKRTQREWKVSKTRADPKLFNGGSTIYYVFIQKLKMLNVSKILFFTSVKCQTFNSVKVVDFIFLFSPNHSYFSEDTNYLN